MSAVWTALVARTPAGEYLCLHCGTADTSQLCGACIERLPDSLLLSLANSRKSLLDCVAWLSAIDREARRAA